DSAAVVAHYDGADGKPQAYTLAEALQDAMNPAAPRFDPNSIPILHQWIESQLVQRALRIEATKRHVAEEPEVVRRARAQVDNQLLQQVYVNQVASRIGRPDSADVHASFTRHAAQ